MANPEHLAILKRGVEVWNQWRIENPDVMQPDLTATELQMADFRSANFRGVNFQNADLTATNLDRANLSFAKLLNSTLRDATLIKANLFNIILVKTNLVGANLSDAILHEADIIAVELARANLTGVSFFKAGISQTNFIRATLDGADFSYASIQNCIFANTDISSVYGLDTVKCPSPSTIGIDTIYRSDGKIPESFLLGCGVPESFITQIPTLIGAVEPFQYHSCFISYSTKDEEFAQRLYSRLRDAKVRVWYSPESIKGGEKLYDQMERAIQFHERLLLVISESSIQSGWVETEIRKAFEIERKENRRKLFPIRLTDVDTIKKWRCFDADAVKDLAAEMREYFIPDFSNWKDPDSFEKGFERLLGDLKNAEPDKEKIAFTTSVVFDEEECLPAFVVPQKENLKLTTRLSELSSLGCPLLKDEKGMTALAIKKPTNFDETVVFCGELLQYKVISDLDKIQRDGWTVSQMSGTVSSEVKNPIKTSDLVSFSVEDIALILSGNRFSKGIMEESRWCYPGLPIPSGTKIQLQYLPSSERTGPDKHKITIEKQNFFKAAITIQAMGASTPSILPLGLRLLPDKAAKCRTYQFAVTLEAEFDNEASGTRQIQEYKTWLRWLFAEVKKNLAD